MLKGDLPGGRRFNDLAKSIRETLWRSELDGWGFLVTSSLAVAGNPILGKKLSLILYIDAH
jgi:hypothetical protein